jgi:hypothetical protein
MRDGTRGILWGMALLLVGALAVGCAPRRALEETPLPGTPAQVEITSVIEAKLAQVPTRDTSLALTILHTNDVGGMVDPCG